MILNYLCVDYNPNEIRCGTNSILIRKKDIDEQDRYNRELLNT